MSEDTTRSAPFFTPTAEDREAMVEDIGYEIQQLRRAMAAAASYDPDDPTGWLIAEAGLIHARCLMEFLFLPSHLPREGQQATARAAWYTRSRDWSPAIRRREFERQLEVSVSEVKRRIDRRVCHLALDRSSTERAHLTEIGPAVDTMWRSMHANLLPEWQDRFPR